MFKLNFFIPFYTHWKCAVHDGHICRCGAPSLLLMLVHLGPYDLGLKRPPTTFTEGWPEQGWSSVKADRAPSAILSIHVGVGHPLYQILSFGWILFAFGMEGDKYFRSYFSVAGFSLLRWNMQIEPWTAVALQSGWYFGGPYFKVSDSSISLNNSAV